ncbi:transposase domain-containing protein [Cryobacterium sp. Y57]|uniref:transposase domain-containing protein n=1 Tax=Cryobacterium sp. Y57 TaxID=2048287 RepID=UPI000CE3777E
MSDLVSIGVMTTVFTPGVVDEVIASCGRTEKRRRSLPIKSMAYYATGMALHSDESYEDVFAAISDGSAWADRAEHTPKLALRAARVRL